MEDYEAQEHEFWAKLSEEGMSRSQMLRRSAAAALGLTVLGAPASALASRARLHRLGLADERCGRLGERACQRGQEGRAPERDRTAARLGELRRDHQHVPEEVRARHDAGEPERHLGRREPGDLVAQGQFTRPGRGRRLTGVRDRGREGGPLRPLQGLRVGERADDPARCRRARWTGDYWGAVSIGFNTKLVNPPPASWKDLLKPAYKGQVALNGSPLTSGSAVGGVFAAALANGGSLNNVGPGIDFFAKLKDSGNFITVQSTPQTVASGQTPISIDWDYLNLAYVKEFPAASWKVYVPSDGVYGSYYAQAVNATAPHPWAARLWEEFLYSDQGQLLWLKGYSHPIRFQDLAKRKVIPRPLLAALPAANLYATGPVRDRRAADGGEEPDRQGVAEQDRRLEHPGDTRSIGDPPAGRRIRPEARAAGVARGGAVLRLRDRVPARARRAR